MMKHESTQRKTVPFKQFRLLPQHLERLLEIRRRRREIEPGMSRPAMGTWTR